PVTTGFTAGIAVVIATLQIKDVLGLHLATNPASFFERIVAMARAAPTASGAELAVAALTLALLVFVPRVPTRVPAPLVAVPVGALFAALIGHLFPGHEVATIASRFHGLPSRPPLPMLPWHGPGPGGAPFVLSLATLRELLPGAFAIAMLGGIESLLSAVI